MKTSKDLIDRLRTYASTRKGELAELITEAADALERQTCEDAVSRAAAIEAVEKIFPADPMRNDYTQGITVGAALATEYIKQLPSAQPEKRTEERTETHACDLISRQQAIDAVKSRKTAEQSSAGIMRNAVVDFCVDIIKKLPSAQPQPVVRCKDCKHWLHEHQCIELSEFGTIETLPNEFCSRAERRTDDQT